MMLPTRRATAAFVAAALLGVSLGACGSDAAEDRTAGDRTAEDSATTGTSMVLADEAIDAVAYDTVWARASAVGARTGAVYLNLTSSLDDALVAVEVDPTVATAAALHETVAASGASPAGSTPAMSMRHVERIDLPAGVTVDLQPGGYHIMLTGLLDELKVGDRFFVTLTFEASGALSIEVPVYATMP